MSGSSGSTMAPVAPVLSHAARTTARKKLYEEIVETSEQLLRQTSNADIISGCNACIELYTVAFVKSGWKEIKTEKMEETSDCEIQSSHSCTARDHAGSY